VSSLKRVTCVVFVARIGVLMVQHRTWPLGQEEGGGRREPLGAGVRASGKSCTACRRQQPRSPGVRGLQRG